jgi:hypothetical protein
MMQQQNNTVMRKSDKAAKTSHNFNQNGQTQNVITSNRFQMKTGSTNGKHSFFGARRQTLTNQSSASSSGYHPHHHGEFHRNNQKNAVSSGTYHKKWNNNKNSIEESVISASSCTNSNSTNQNNVINHAVHNNVNKKMKSADSHGYHSSRTSGHASRSKDSFDMDDMKNEIKNMQVIKIDEEKAAEQSVQSLESLQQIQEAKPGNKRALIVDLPPYLYSIPALASFFEPYGEVAMLQILPQKRMWDADLIDLLGASMCNRLANQSLCAIVEFYSARMAKFIIGILRKRLPILKFRCALLKPSAAIELSNQAENLGLQGVVVMKNKPAAKQTISSDSCRDTGSNESEDHDHHDMMNVNPREETANRPSVEFESGCEDVSSSENNNNNNMNNVANNVNHENNNNAQRLPSYASLTESEHNNDNVQTPTPRTESNSNTQRFTTSFQITLGR